MKKRPRTYSKIGWLTGTLAFLLPIFIVAVCLAMFHIYPGSSHTLLASDAFSQFSNFHASYQQMMHGKQSLFYTWNSGLGLNYWALLSYYLGGLFTPLVFFFKASAIADALYVLTLVKIGCAGWTFWYYSKQTFRLSPWLHVALSLCYSLMSFITSHIELVMWLDTFVWLPLIILGINRLMDEKKRGLLFTSYFILFISNYYFGFMVGLFSLLYYGARVVTNWARYKRTIPDYLITAILAGLSSFFMILPTILDLQANGERLSPIQSLKTDGSGLWDLVVKNMVGIYDTTKYDATPFIYVGLVPLIFALLFFISPQINKKKKLAYGSLLALISISFYFEPLNLVWQGMHAPNMFLYRFSFVFSFLLLTLAGYGLEVYRKAPPWSFPAVVISLIFIIVAAYFIHPKGAYAYISEVKLFTTVLFLVLYLIGILFYQLVPQQKPFTQKQSQRLGFLLLVLVGFEAAINTSAMFQGVADEWHFPSRSLYEEPYNAYHTAIEQVQKKETDRFYRIETLAPVSANDSLRYGYSGISQFSSIRNRNSAQLLHSLGFRSRGTHLNTRYQNNTLLMDSLFGIKYNHAETPSTKFGFETISENKQYTMARNKLASPLGILTSPSIYQTKLPKYDNLSAQTKLVNQLSGLNKQFFTYTYPEIIGTDNARLTNNSKVFSLTEQTKNQAKSVTLSVVVPAKKQAYLSLYPQDFGALKSSTATLSVNGHSQTSQLDITGQYYDLGYYPKETKVTFSLDFYGTRKVALLPPTIFLLDTQAYKASFQQIQAHGAEFTVTGRTATTYTTTSKKQVLFTTIPYDKGWRAFVDGTRVPTKPFKKGLLTIPLPAGSHKVELRFLPYGFRLGCFLSISALLGFYWYNRKQQTKTKKRLLE